MLLAIGDLSRSELAARLLRIDAAAAAGARRNRSASALSRGWCGRRGKPGAPANARGVWGVLEAGLGRGPGQVVGIQGNEEEVAGGTRREVVGRLRVLGEVAARGEHPDAVAAERLELRAARQHRDLVPGGGEPRGEMAADRAGAENADAQHVLLAKTALILTSLMV